MTAPITTPDAPPALAGSVGGGAPTAALRTTVAPMALRVSGPLATLAVRPAYSAGAPGAAVRAPPGETTKLAAGQAWVWADGVWDGLGLAMAPEGVGVADTPTVLVVDGVGLEEREGDFDGDGSTQYPAALHLERRLLEAQVLVQSASVEQSQYEPVNQSPHVPKLPHFRVRQPLVV